MLLTEQPAGINCDEPVWSPDGTKILYSTNRSGNDGMTIWIMDVDGGNQKLLLRHTRSRAAWQPRSQAAKEKQRAGEN
jgi:Tol biopolymer transport system component